MALSRYRFTEVLTERFPYRRNARTNKTIPLSFYDRLSILNPSPEMLASLKYVEIAFSTKDTFMSLSEEYYGDPAYWWLIAFINNVSSEQEVQLGQTITILLPAATLMGELGL